MGLNTIHVAAARWPTESVLSALGSGLCSIDSVAGRLGASSRRDVLAVKGVLTWLAAEGRVEDRGGGVWSRPGAQPDCDAAGPVTSQDLLRHGFSGPGGAVSLAQMVRNVEAATGRNVFGVATLLPSLIDAGLVRLQRRRCYALTPSGAAVAPPEPPRPDPRGGRAARVLALMAEPVDRTAIAALLGVSRERARQVAASLVRDGLAVRREVRRADGAVVGLYHAAGRPDPLSLDEVLPARMPPGPVRVRTLARALDRHAPEVRAALVRLAGTGAVAEVPATAGEAAWVALPGEVGPKTLPEDPEALDALARTAYALLARDALSAEILRAAAGPGRTAEADALLRRIAAAGHCADAGDIRPATPLGTAVATALRRSER